jgi:hypothetical protein
VFDVTVINPNQTKSKPVSYVMMYGKNIFVFFPAVGYKIIMSLIKRHKIIIE